jgi:predicted deacylase
MEPILARSTTWIRAPISGVFRTLVPLGGKVRREETLGLISDPFGENETAVLAPQSGVIIGRLNLPLVHEGEAVFHLARFERGAPVEQAVEQFRSGLWPDALDDSPPIL